MRSTFVSEAGLLIAFEKSREELSGCCAIGSAFVRLSLIPNNFVYANTNLMFLSSFFEAPKFLWRFDLKLVTNSFCECKLV